MNQFKIYSALNAREHVENERAKVAMNLNSFEYVTQLILSSDSKEKDEVFHTVETFILDIP